VRPEERKFKAEGQEWKGILVREQSPLASGLGEHYRGMHYKRAKTSQVAAIVI